MPNKGESVDKGSHMKHDHIASVARLLALGLTGVHAFDRALIHLADMANLPHPSTPGPATKTPQNPSDTPANTNGL